MSKDEVPTGTDLQPPVRIEQGVGGIYSSARRYLPFTAAGAMAETILGAATNPPPLAAASAPLAALALLLSLVADRTTLDADIT